MDKRLFILAYLFIGLNIALHAQPEGTLKWSYSTGGTIYSSPAIGSDGTIYVGSRDKKLYALNPNGILKWYYTTEDVVSSSPAIGTDGTVYVGSWDKKLYAINLDGTLKWGYTTDSRVSSSPAIGTDGTVYFGSYDKKLYAINPDGTLKWSYVTGRIASSSPAISSDGTLYVGSRDNKVYAIQTSSMGLADSPWPKFRHDNQNTGNVLTVDNNNQGTFSDQFYLHQNYPNPFNSVTTIQFSVKEKGLVLLKIFNITGQYVQTLVEREYYPGNYQVTFNTQYLPSGLYLYSMEAGRYRAVKKMILLE